MLIAALTLLLQANWIWIEAENPSSTNFPPAERNPFAPANAEEASKLSGGKWIGVEGKREQPFFAEYAVSVGKDGTYQLYTRKFWKHGPYRWRIDSGDWHEVGPEVALMDESPLRKFVGANWTYGGEAKLGKGSHTLRVETTSNEGAAAFDCFILTTDAFIARGKLKPGQKYGLADPGFFAFEPDPDPYKPTPLDLRSLNEKRAGDEGFLSVKGEEIVHSKTGKPVRFWALNTGADTPLFDHATIRNMARQWAKGGVNLVRVHGGPWGDDFKTVRPQYLDGLQFFVQAMKEQGIYTCVSIYFPLWMHPPFDHSPFEGYNGRNPFDLIYFNPEFQKIYRDWWRQILTAKSPYSGMALAEDPAVGVTEIVNEESHFFWTFIPYTNLPEPYTHELETQFGSWLAKKYGSVREALHAWGGGPVRGDDPGAGRAGILELWQIFGSKNQRAQDTARFLAENQRDFYKGMYDYLKNELGFKGLVYGSNWITAEPRILGPLDKWSNTVADIMDRHGYFDLGHTGERAGYSISPGDKFYDVSALQFPAEKDKAPTLENRNFSLPIFDIQYNGKPSTITEINWTPPNSLRADFPIVASAYGALQGTDAMYFFATGSPWWEEQLGKFGIHTPVTFGQFPAAAFMYRQGLVKPGPKVVEANLNLNRLFALEGAPLSTPAALDQLRAADIPAGRAKEVPKVEAIDPLAFLVGKVGFNFVDSDRPSSVMDLSKYIDHKLGVARSATGELEWNYQRGLVTVNAPGAQGATGFIGGAIDLRSIRIETTLPYGAVMVIALDGKPLSSSKKMLLQVMSQEQNYGWKTTGTGQKTIVSTGSAPMNVRELSGTVRFKRADARKLKVTALDFNGYPAKRLASADSLRLLPNVIYYLIEG